MKKFFLIAIFSILFFPSCSQVDPIIGDVCEITQEICYWANLVCENYEKENIPALQKDKVKFELISIVEDLKKEADFASQNSTKSNPLNEAQLKYELIQIRNQLKEMYLQKQKE